MGEMRTVAIVGVGLIGGSFGLALRKAGFQGEILGVSSERSIGEAKERGAIDRGVCLTDAAGAAASSRTDQSRTEVELSRPQKLAFRRCACCTARS